MEIPKKMKVYEAETIIGALHDAVNCLTCRQILCTADKGDLLALAV